MTNAYTRFIQRLPKNASIIDLGAGSGRDLLFFRNNGFYIEGIDSSEQLCELARHFSNCNVKCCSIQAWYPKEKYTGIWANASLLHLTEQELLLFWKRVPDILIENGLIYFSMKKGIMTGFDNMGRYFTDFSDRLEVAMFELVPIRYNKLRKFK
jgi:trans-aconitate methyltransferase